MPLSTQLVETASKRLKDKSERTEADLRRVLSDLYYALFHRVCEALVDPIGVDTENKAFIETYRTLYRQPEHAFLEKRCREVKDHAFCSEVKAFARLLIVMKNKRTDADYDPLEKHAISSVTNDLASVEATIKKFNSVDPTERARFAYFVSIKGRKLA